MNSLRDLIFFGEQPWEWEIFKIDFENTLFINYLFINYYLSLSSLLSGQTDGIDGIAVDGWFNWESDSSFSMSTAFASWNLRSASLKPKTWVYDGGKSFEEF
jgi:hypothetical protein